MDRTHASERACRRTAAGTRSFFQVSANACILVYDEAPTDCFSVNRTAEEPVESAAC